MCFPEGLENILFTKHFRISYSFTLLFTYVHIEKKVWKKALLERKKVLSPRLCNIGQNKRQVELAILKTFTESWVSKQSFFALKLTTTYKYLLRIFFLFFKIES